MAGTARLGAEDGAVILRSAEVTGAIGQDAAVIELERHQIGTCQAPADGSGD